MKKKIALVLAGGAALVALLAVPMAAADTIPTVTGLTSDEIDALGLEWDASLEDWSTAFATSATQCTGVLVGTYEDVTVPPGGYCKINVFTRIEHDLTVLDGARLEDDGAYIGHDVRAKNPLSMNLSDSGPVPAAPGTPGVVGHDIHIQGTTGLSLRYLTDNWICDTEVGHDVVVKKSAFTAGRWVIGSDSDPNYVGCGNDIAHDLVVKENANRVDISGNNPTGGLTTVAGIGHDLKVAKNSGTTAVNDNLVGHDCTQSDNSPYAGAGNSAGNNNNCNAVY